MQQEEFAKQLKKQQDDELVRIQTELKEVRLENQRLASATTQTRAQSYQVSELRWPALLFLLS